MAEPLTRAELCEIVDAVPAVDRFPSVDELVARTAELASSSSGVAQVRRIGSSKLGEPVCALTVGDFDQHAVVFAGVHPNEPVGGLSALRLASVLIADEALRRRLGYTWHIVPCIDPDGMRLNEGWFAHGFSREQYGRHFYRPAPAEQVEWAFPWAYKDAYFDRTIPETEALMRLIDEARPTFMCSLHNGEHGGVYYYLTEPCPELYEPLSALPAHVGVPLDMGEPERPYMQTLAPAIYQYAGADEEYDYLESLGADPSQLLTYGSSSPSYAARYRTLTLISEVPYWHHPDASDDRPTEHSYADLLNAQAAGFAEMAHTLEEVLNRAEPDLRIDSPFRRASRAFIPGLSTSAAQMQTRAASTDPARLATVAQAFSLADRLHSFRLRFGGILLRTLDAEIDAGMATPGLREQRRRLDASYMRWVAEADEVSTPNAIPIAHLVGVQLGAILATADHARGRFGPATSKGSLQ